MKVTGSDFDGTITTNNVIVIKPHHLLDIFKLGYISKILMRIVLNTLSMNMYPLLQIIKEEAGETWSFGHVLNFAAYPSMKVMEELKVKDP